VINRYEARIESCDRKHAQAWLRLKRGRLATRLWHGFRAGNRVAVRIRPEDVLLCLGHPGRVSARNVLPGHVTSLRSVPEGVYVAVDVGFPLRALVLRRAVEELGLRRRLPIFAIVKAAAIVPEFDGKFRCRVSFEGKRGSIDPDEIEFLQAVDRTGSLSAAARELGVTFRTAWNRARAANRRWGSPLLTRTQGGRGGGGASLTPEGRALVEAADRLERTCVRTAGPRVG
jgi:molybdate transport system regulatory protein